MFYSGTESTLYTSSVTRCVVYDVNRRLAAVNLCVGAGREAAHRTFMVLAARLICRQIDNLRVRSKLSHCLDDPIEYTAWY
jgi:hypothetical protein